MGHRPLAATMFVLAASNAAVGWSLKGLGAPFLWTAISLVITGAAYWAGEPSWLGKRADGTQRLALVILNLPFLIVAHFAAHLRRLGSEACWNEITPTLYLGRRARAHELPNVDLIVDLTAEFPEDAAVRQGRAYRLLRSLDGCAPDVDSLRGLLSEVASWSGAMFIHCAVGHGRSAMFAAGILILRGEALSVDDAEAMLRRARPGVEIKPSQRLTLERALLGLPVASQSRSHDRTSPE